MSDDGLIRRPVVAAIALGSNLGPREAHLEAARESLAKSPGTELAAWSRVYQTPPVGPPGQGPYLNAVVAASRHLIWTFQLSSVERSPGEGKCTS